MNEIKHLPKTLPSRNAEFEIDIVGSLTKSDYKGGFSCKIPNQRAQSLIAKHKAFLNAGFDATLDKQIKNLHHMVSYLKFTIDKAPEWFIESDSGYDLYDTNVVEEIYHKVLKTEEDWLNTVWGSDKDNESE